VSAVAAARRAVRFECAHDGPVAPCCWSAGAAALMHAARATPRDRARPVLPSTATIACLSPRMCP
jgi:hypothetical protein